MGYKVEGRQILSSLSSLCLHLILSSLSLSFTSNQSFNSFNQSIMSSSLSSLHSELIKSFQTSSPDLPSIGKQLSTLKILLTTNGLLFPSQESESSPDQLKMARDVLEIGAYWSVRVRDTKAFDRYMDLLRAFYDSR